MTLYRGESLLDPKSDLVFKRIFGQNADLLTNFLNNILPFKEDQMIEKLEYLTSEQIPINPEYKHSIVDVKCTDSKGRIFIVEMQMVWSPIFQRRLFFGAANAYVSQLPAAGAYASLYPVYSLAIINDIYDKDSEKWFHEYKMTEVDCPQNTIEDVRLFFLELPKFQPKTFAHKKIGVLWLRFLKEIQLSKDAISEEIMSTPELSKAVGLLIESSYSRQELEAYNSFLDAARVHQGIIDDAAESIKKAEAMAAESIKKAEAIAKAAEEKARKAETIAAESIKEAEAIAAESIKEAEAIATAAEEKARKADEIIIVFVLNLFKKDLPLEEISEISGISIEEVEKILSQEQGKKIQ